MKEILIKNQGMLQKEWWIGMIIIFLILLFFLLLIIKNKRNRRNTSMDNMEGYEFEYYCAELLERKGFIEVEVTKGSGDYGIDILAEKEGVTYAIQCKCYSSNVGNDAVQQALAGKKFYKRDIAVVLTNQYFTPQAKEEASVFGVKLWDRTKLNEFVQNINN